MSIIAPSLKIQSSLLLIVDYQCGFTQPDGAFYFQGIEEPLKRTLSLKQSMDNLGVPVLFTRVAYRTEEHARSLKFVSKIPTLATLTLGQHGTELDPIFGEVDPGDIITKTQASCFFKTDLHARLSRLEITDLLLAGVSTGGCIRATAVDAVAHNYQVSILEDCVADANLESHGAALNDISRKYGYITKSPELEIFNNDKTT